MRYDNDGPVSGLYYAGVVKTIFGQSKPKISSYESAVYANAQTDESAEQKLIDAFESEIETQRTEIDDLDSRVTALEGDNKEAGKNG
ncbi:MAG TPA: hypothetical protein VEB88_05990 [Candidatus Acidoferrales bacterium]|nr:hypothetical protein [Candidatus Acidoferrales bacterium]